MDESLLDGLLSIIRKGGWICHRASQGSGDWYRTRRLTQKITWTAVFYIYRFEAFIAHESVRALLHLFHMNPSKTFRGDMPPLTKLMITKWNVIWYCILWMGMMHVITIQLKIYEICPNYSKLLKMLKITIFRVNIWCTSYLWWDKLELSSNWHFLIQELLVLYTVLHNK